MLSCITQGAGADIDTVHQCVLVIGIGYIAFVVIANSANPLDQPIRLSHRRQHRIGLLMWLLLSLAAWDFFYSNVDTELGLLEHVLISAIPTLLVTILVYDIISGFLGNFRSKKRKPAHHIKTYKRVPPSISTVAQDPIKEVKADAEYLDMTMRIDEAIEHQSPVNLPPVKLLNSDEMLENEFAPRAENIESIMEQAKKDRNARLAAERRIQILEETLNILRKENDYLTQDAMRIQAERNQV